MPNNLHWPPVAQPPELAPDEAHVWAVPLDVSQRTYDGFLATLSLDERARAAAYRFDEPRRRFVVTRGALRELLGKYLDEHRLPLELTVDQHQKPRLASQYASTGLNFNVSHSGELSLIAFAVGCEVGVDIEELRAVSYLDQIARKFFHPAETAEVLNVPDDVRSVAFLRCWTGKEAILKALGTGIVTNLADFRVPSGSDWRGWIECSTGRSDRPRSRCWVEQLTPSSEYVSAIACAESRRSIRSYAI